MASGSSSLLKGVFVLLFIAAVFVGLTFLLEGAPEQVAPVATSPENSDSSDSQPAEGPEVAEARQLGSEIGARVGEEIGRRVGQLLVAELEADSGTADASAADEAVMVAEADDTADSTYSETSEADAAPAPEVADSSDEFDTTADMSAESESAAVDMQDDSETAASGTTVMADEPAIEAPAAASVARAEAEPDPSKAFTFSSNGWWSDTGDFRVLHVGQLASASELSKSIVVRLSGAYKGGQNLEQLLKVSKADGSKVSGVWRRSANAQDLFFAIDQAGEYQLSISAELSAKEGGKLGKTLSGSVSVQ